MPKIEISSVDGSGVYGYEIFDLNKQKPIRNNKSSMFPRFFGDDDVYNLIGEKNWRKFEKGAYQFNVTNKDIFIVTDDFAYYSPRFANDRDVLSRTF